jgi:hypothetical protein
VQLRQRFSGMSVMAVFFFAALVVTVLAQPASRAVSLLGSQIASPIDAPGCGYGVLAVCLVRDTTDRGRLDDDGEVWFSFDDQVGIGFYRAVPERY